MNDFNLILRTHRRTIYNVTLPCTRVKKKLTHQNFTPPKKSHVYLSIHLTINYINNPSWPLHRQSLPAVFWAFRPLCYWWNPAIPCSTPHILAPRWWLRPSEEMFEYNSSKTVSNFRLSLDQKKKHNWNSISDDFHLSTFWRCCFSSAMTRITIFFQHEIWPWSSHDLTMSFNIDFK